MCAASETLDADIVGGPQVPVFEDASHARWAAHPVFAPPYAQTGLVEALYSSGNLLLGRNVLMRMGPPFLDLRFNFMGGGDSDFLSRSRQAGFRLAWCAEAKTLEMVPARRVEADWIRARSLRNGVIFHASGPLRMARNAAMKMMGDRLLDQPWLYGAQ